MGEVSTIGVDIAKSVFQIHGVDAGGTVVIRRRVGRARVLEFFADLPPCLVGMEACATAHQWARELKKLGHDTRLMPPTYVKAYVKRGTNDAADAAALCEAVTRPAARSAAASERVTTARPSPWARPAMRGRGGRLRAPRSARRCSARSTLIRRRPSTTLPHAAHERGSIFAILTYSPQALMSLASSAFSICELPGNGSLPRLARNVFVSSSTAI
jgi:transposase